MKTADAGQEVPAEKVDISSALSDALKNMEQELKPLIVELGGQFDAANKIVRLNAKCMDNERAENALHRIFFDLFFYLPVDPTEMIYVLEMNTYSEPSFKNKVHSFFMETRVDRMPDTGLVTRAEWNEFIGQLRYTKDGVDQTLPSPEPFYDDVTEEKTE